LRPWETKQLPLKMVRWLGPVGTAINAIKNSG
jgi:hypothetical protein